MKLYHGEHSLKPRNNSVSKEIVILQMPTSLSYILALFPVPFIVYALSSGGTLLYYITYFSWIILANAKLFSMGLMGRKPSPIVTLITIILFVNFFATSFNPPSTTIQTKSFLLIKLIVFTNVLYIFDLLRCFGIMRVFSPTVPMAFLTIILSLAHLLVNPEIHYDRYYYFGMHPNLGGEILFGMCILIFWGNRPTLLLIGLLASAYCMFLLQARTAMVALLVLCLSYACWKFFSGRITLKIAFLSGICLASLLFIFYLHPLDYLTYFFLEEVMLVNNKYRGFNTGLTGRIATWEWAIVLFNQRPFFGYGVDQSPLTDLGLEIHSGILLLLAEFGILGIILLITLSVSFIRNVIRQHKISAALIACLVILILSPRLINMNIFPIIMWIALLKWPKGQIDFKPNKIVFKR